MADNIPEVTDTNFQVEVLESEVPVLVVDVVPGLALGLARDPRQVGLPGSGELIAGIRADPGVQGAAEIGRGVRRTAEHASRVIAAAESHQRTPSIARIRVANPA